MKISFIRNKPKPGVPYWLAKVIDPIDDYEYYRKEEVLELCRQTCFSVTEPGKVYVFFVTARCKEAALKISNEMFGAVKVMEDQGMLKGNEVYRISDMKDMGENLYDCSI